MISPAPDPPGRAPSIHPLRRARTCPICGHSCFRRPTCQPGACARRVLAGPLDRPSLRPLCSIVAPPQPCCGRRLGTAARARALRPGPLASPPQLVLQVLDCCSHLVGVPRRPVVARRQPRNPGTLSCGHDPDRELFGTVSLAQVQEPGRQSDRRQLVGVRWRRRLRRVLGPLVACWMSSRCRLALRFVCAGEVDAPGCAPLLRLAVRARRLSRLPLVCFRHRLESPFPVGERVTSPATRGRGPRCRPAHHRALAPLRVHAQTEVQAAPVPHAQAVADPVVRTRTPTVKSGRGGLPLGGLAHHNSLGPSPGSDASRPTFGRRDIEVAGTSSA